MQKSTKCALKVYDDCHAGVPEKIIRDVTGHRSNALHLYERPTVEQKVSNVLIQGSQEKENSGHLSVKIKRHDLPCLKLLLTPSMVSPSAVSLFLIWSSM